MTARTPLTLTDVLAPAGLFVELAGLVSTLMDQVLATLGTSLSQLRILAIVADGPAPPSAIARVVGLSTQTLTERVDTLEKAGLVERTRTSTDRRVITIVITTRGQALVERCGPRAAGAVDALCTGVSTETNEELRLLRDRLRQALGGGQVL